jgi:hypothetical protein
MNDTASMIAKLAMALAAYGIAMLYLIVISRAGTIQPFTYVQF